LKRVGRKTKRKTGKKGQEKKNPSRYASYPVDELRKNVTAVPEKAGFSKGRVRKKKSKKKAQPV